MKETYYKLNREKLETKLNAALFETLLEIGILEEVQDTKEDLPYSVEIENRKLEEESQGMSIKSRHLLDNMFGNPLEQVDSMIEGTKPFLDGMKPSAYHWKRVSEMLLEEVPLPNSQARHIAILEIIDFLVEELKKNNAIK